MANDKHNVTPEHRSGSLIFLEYVKTIAWPAFGLILLFSFWTSLQEIASQLPKLLRRAESITIGKVAIKMPRSVVDRIPHEVQDVLKRLEPSDIRNILSEPYVVGSTVYFENENEWEIKPWRRLKDLGLLSEYPEKKIAEYNKEHKLKAKVVFELNPLFINTRESLVNMTAALISEAEASVEAERKSNTPK
jgi:hypothetical protein